VNGSETLKLIQSLMQSPLYEYIDVWEHSKWHKIACNGSKKSYMQSTINDSINAHVLCVRPTQRAWLHQVILCFFLFHRNKISVVWIKNWFYSECKSVAWSALVTAPGKFRLKPKTDGNIFIRFNSVAWLVLRIYCQNNATISTVRVIVNAQKISYFRMM